MLIAALSYSKFESIQLQREESAENSNESRKILFILLVLRQLTLPFNLQIACTLFSR